MITKYVAKSLCTFTQSLCGVLLGNIDLFALFSAVQVSIKCEFPQRDEQKKREKKILVLIYFLHNLK